MEEKLTRLFDFQRFGGNARLNAIIAGAEERYAGALTDDDLEMVSAAGEEHPCPEESEQPGKVGAVMILIPEGEGS